MAMDESEAADAGETVIEPQRDRPLQRKKVKKNGWTKERRKIFLRTLAATCNVSRSVAAAGKSIGTAYRLRHRDEEFAAQWQAALLVGYERLEAALLRRAIETVEHDAFAMLDDEEDGESEGGGGEAGKDRNEARRGDGAAEAEAEAAPLSAMSVDQAISLLARHRATLIEGTLRPRRPHARRVPTAEETDRALLDRLAKMKRMRAGLHGEE
ncbi:MAG: hypothetical protein GW859_10600 [Sphingomonadales bacterium]|nr:hypothetical protein [Sphingomonadales bacterium]